MKPRIDHFYIVVPQVHFERLKKEFINEGWCEHKVVESNQGKWEGLYLGFKNGFYLEILKPEKDFKAFRTGLALSHMGHEKYSSDFVKENGLIKELFKKDEKNWFYAFFKKEQRNNSFVPWYTSYLGSFRKSRRWSFKNSSLNKKIILLDLPQKYIEEISKESSWLPLEIKQNNKKLKIKGRVMEIQLRPARTFRLKLK